MNNRDIAVRSDDRIQRSRSRSGMTRRDAVGKLTSLGACAGALALAPQLANGNTPGSEANAAIPGLEDLKQLVGTGFTVSGPVFGEGAAVGSRLTLDNVTEVRWVRRFDPPPVEVQRDCPISLVFSSRVEIPDATYIVTPDKTAGTRMFLHRIGDSTPEPPFIYEAILN